MGYGWRKGLTRLVVAAALVMAPACGDDGPHAPTTPQITAGGEDPDLERKLLTVDEMQALPDAPGGLSEQPVEDGSLFENPDPRGPCGAKAVEPSPEDGVLRVFTADRLTIVTGAWELESGEAEGMVEAFRADARPGCPAFVSETPWGKQTVRLVDVVEISGGDGLATTARIDVPGGSQRLYAAAGLYRAEERLGLVSMFGPAPMGHRFVQGVVEAALAKL